jgi:hypothetical protein
MSVFKPGDLVVKTAENSQWIWTADGHNTLSQERLQVGIAAFLLSKMDSRNNDWLCLTSTGVVGVIAIKQDGWKASSST